MATELRHSMDKVGVTTRSLRIPMSARLAIPALLASGMVAASSPVSDGSFTVHPWLQNVSDTAITIMWESALHEPGSVAFGRDGALDRTVASTSTLASPGLHVHKARLAGLQPGTRYAFRAAQGSESAEGAFTTAPRVGTGTIRFGIWGDSHRQHPALEMFRFMTDSLHVDFAASTGDVSNDGFDPADLRSSFIPTTLAGIGSKVPFFIATGNHDVATATDPINAIRRYFDLPKDANSDSSGMSGSYMAVYGPVAMIFIDGARSHSDIPAWLDQQLKSKPARDAGLAFVFIHNAPFYERWQAEGEDPFIKSNYPPVLASNHVAASFSGHMHGYERGFLGGTHYVTAGGGSRLDVFEPIGSDYDFIRPGAFEALPANHGLLNHFLTVDATSDFALVRMHAFDAAGTYLGVRDSFPIARPGIRPPWNTYPNPPRFAMRGAWLVVESSCACEGTLELVRINGHLIRALSQPGRRFDLSGVPAGLHIARWRSPEGSFSQPILLPGR